MKLTCSCGATGEFRDNMCGAVDANKWNASHEVCRTYKRDRDTALMLLRRYRNETPLGHQPHMISHEVDELLARCKQPQETK